MPSIAGMLSSIGPTLPANGLAPSAASFFIAAPASRTRNAMALADGPCALAKPSAWLSGSAFKMKFTSPWR